MTNYSSYEHERQRKAEERRLAPKHCSYCETAINEHLSEWDRIKTSCGSDKCRKAASRSSLAERKRQARADVRTRVLQYCEQQLDQKQKQAMMEMCDALMAYSIDEGHEIAERVVQIIEAKRCKHDRIEVLERNAAVWKQRAQASERQLNERIKELEAELALFNGLEATIHGIAMRQLLLQPDPNEQMTTLTSEANGKQNEDEEDDDTDEDEE